MPIRLFVFSLLFLFGFSAHAETLKIATWNIANLHHETGIALRDRAMARRDIDYQRLQETGKALNADIIALQEIGSPAALMRVFPKSDYHLVISDRYSPGDEKLPAAERDIFVAFAISKSAFPKQPAIRTLSAFSITHFDVDRDGNPEDRPTRSAQELTIELNGKTVKVLNLHLKSSCFDNPITVVEDLYSNSPNRNFRRYDCRTQKAQLSILENYVEMQKQLGNYVILTGDFNRHLNKTKDGKAEDFWADLNDGSPDNMSLIKGPTGLDKVCWPKHENRYEDHIDFVIVDSELVSKAPEISKISMGYESSADYQEDASDPNAPRYRQRLSDHCPVISTIEMN